MRKWSEERSTAVIVHDEIESEGHESGNGGAALGVEAGGGDEWVDVGVDDEGKEAGLAAAAVLRARSKNSP